VQLDVTHGVLLAAGRGEVVTDREERNVVLTCAHPLLDAT
jgi:hypothetical protein